MGPASISRSSAARFPLGRPGVASSQNHLRKRPGRILALGSAKESTGSILATISPLSRLRYAAAGGIPFFPNKRPGKSTKRTVRIRPETPGDNPFVREIHELAFGQPAEAKLVETLRRAPDFAAELSLVGVTDEAVGETVVGHILFSPIRIGETAALALAPLAVLPSHQRRGIGSALVREGLAACAAEGHTIVIVLGHHEFYPRFGFQTAREHGITAPFEVPDEAFMVWAASPQSLQGVRGLVVYPTAFDGV